MDNLNCREISTSLKHNGLLIQLHKASANTVFSLRVDLAQPAPQQATQEPPHNFLFAKLRMDYFGFSSTAKFFVLLHAYERSHSCADQNRSKTHGSVICACHRRQCLMLASILCSASEAQPARYAPLHLRVPQRDNLDHPAPKHHTPLTTASKLPQFFRQRLQNEVALPHMRFAWRDLLLPREAPA